MKFDLAVFDSEAKPMTLIEGKHLFDFDFFKPSIKAKYRTSVQRMLPR
jgi:hypothetical protein